MIEEKFDAIVVGAGMAGNAAALHHGRARPQGPATRARRIFRLQECAGRDPLCRHAREDHPRFPRGRAAGAPSGRAALLDDGRPLAYGAAISLRRFQRGAAQPLHHHPRAVRQMVLQEGAARPARSCMCETTVTELVQDAYGKVIGVRTDRASGPGLRRCRRAGRRRQRTARHARRPAQDARQARQCRAGGQGNALPAAGDDRGALQSARRRGRRHRGGRHDLARA